MEQYLIVLTHEIMKLQELSMDERLSIYGGSEASESLMFWAGAICKGVYYVAIWHGDYFMTPVAEWASRR